MQSNLSKLKIGTRLLLSLALVSPITSAFVDGSAQAAAQVAAQESGSVYIKDFNDGNVSGWKKGQAQAQRRSPLTMGRLRQRQRGL